MKVLLTGHKGFIGSNLLKKLNELGHQVSCLERGDNFEVKQIEAIIKQIEVIFHVGAISDTTLQDANEMLYYNYSTSKLIFDLANKHNVKVIYSSSAANYGDGDSIPNNIYGWSKLLAENYGLNVCDKFVALRYFNVYGPGEQHKGKMASVAYQAWKSHTFKLFPGDIKRDFIYVEDVVKANIHAMKIDRGLFDVGTGKAETFENLLKGIGVKFDYHTEDKIPIWYQYFTQADKKKFMPGWQAENDIKQGTEKYRNFLLANI